MSTENNISFLEVTIVIAVSDDGRVEVSADDPCRLIEKRKHQEWLKSIGQHEQPWTIKTIKTLVPMPSQYEDQTQ